MTSSTFPSPSALSGSLLEMLFQQLPIGVALFDTELNLVRCNPVFTELVQRYIPTGRDGIRPGASLYAISPGNEALFAQAIARVFQGESVHADSIRTESGGVVSYWDGLLAPVIKDGQIVGVLDIVMDVTERTLAQQKVQESEAALRSLVENASRFAIFRVAIDTALPFGGQLEFVSPSILDMMGLDDDKRFESWFELLHPDDAERVYQANQRAVLYGEPYNQVARVFNRHKNAWRWVHTISNPYRDADGTITHFDGMVIDLTDQVTLQDAERRRATAEGLRDILRLINANHPLPEILQTIALQAKQLLGADSTMIRQRSPETNQVLTVASCDLPADFDAIREQPAYLSSADQALLSGKPVVIEDVQAEYLPRLSTEIGQDPLRRAGIEATLRHYRSLLKMPLFFKAQLFGALTLHFIEPRKFQEEDLQLALMLASQASLAIENSRLIEKVKETAVLDERSRLARELHDAVTQTLFSTTLTAEVLPKIWKKDPAEGLKKLEELRELTRGALAEMRTLLMELRPAALEDADLKDLLRHLTNAFIARARVPVQLELDGSQSIPLEVKICCYRIAQEALHNVAKHAEASQVEVTLRQTPAEIDLTVRDDGLGFDVAIHPPDHFGLKIMHERAAQIGAALTIESQPDQGTCVRLRWAFPLEA